MPSNVLGRKEMFKKFSDPSESCHGEGSFIDSEENENSSVRNMGYAKFKGKYYRLRNYIKDLVFVSNFLNILNF